MKHILRLFLLFVVLFTGTIAATGQTVATKDANGNYTQVDAPAKTEAELTANCTKSGGKFTDKAGVAHEVWLAPSGKLFYIGTTKSGKNIGKPRRVYFKTIESAGN